MIRIYGRSDDLVEIEGSNYAEDEIGCYNQDVIIIFEDGTQIKVGYSKGNIAVWYIVVECEGTAEYNPYICNDEDADIYSDIFEIDSEIKTHRLEDK